MLASNFRSPTFVRSKLRVMVNILIDILKLTEVGTMRFYDGIKIWLPFTLKFSTGHVAEKGEMSRRRS